MSIRVRLEKQVENSTFHPILDIVTSEYDFGGLHSWL